MKKKILMGCSLLMLTFLSACGESSELSKFRNEIDSFCTDISNIDSAINNIDAESDDAISELLLHLDKLEEQFNDFGELDFPEEFDYLEPLADEAASYMTEAVSSYHDTYEGGGYDEASASYAKENYARAYKRIQIIITFLHGEEPEDVGLSITEE